MVLIGVLIAVLIVPGLYLLGYSHAVHALQNQTRRDTRSAREYEHIADRTRRIAKAHGGNWPPNGEHIW